MKTYWIAIKNELYKAINRRKTKWLIGITWGLGLLVMIAIFLIQNLTSTHVVNTSDLAIWQLQQMSTFILPLFTAMMTVDLFAGEVSNESIKNTLLMPINRNKAYLAKISALSIMILSLLGSLFVINMVFGSLFFGLGSIQFFTTFLAYMGTSIPLIMMSVLVSVIALIFKSSSSALTCSIIIYIGFRVFGLLASRLAIYMPTSYMAWYRYPIASNTFYQMLLFMIAYIIMFISVGLLRFESKEI